MAAKLGPNPGIAFKDDAAQTADIWITELIRLTNRFQKMPLQADSTATTVADLRTDFNSLLAKLKTAGFMESS